jgi:hypothetical protein
MTRLGTGAIQPDGTLDFAWCDDDGAVRGAYSTFACWDTLRAYLYREGITDFEWIVTRTEDGQSYYDIIIVSADLPALKLSVFNAGREWSAAKDDERAAMATLYAAVVAAHAAGVTEVEAARLAGVDRMTVRRALGKL